MHSGALAVMPLVRCDTPRGNRDATKKRYREVENPGCLTRRRSMAAQPRQLRRQRNIMQHANVAKCSLPKPGLAALQWDGLTRR